MVGKVSSKEERLREIIDKVYSGNQRKFASAMNLDSSVVSRVLTGKYNLPKRCDELLRKENINPDYYRNGSGNIVENSTILLEKHATYNMGGKIKQDHSSKDETVSILKDYIETLKETNRQLQETNKQLLARLSKLE